MYYIPFCDIEKFYERSINGGRKSFRFDEIDKKYKGEKFEVVLYQGESTKSESFLAKQPQ